MDSDFIEHLQRVSLTDEVIIVRSEHREKTLEEWSLSLLGRFYTNKRIKLGAAKNHLRSAWRMGGDDLEITHVGDGLLRFKFSMECQLKWVINNGPWSFDNHILLLQRWEKGMAAFSVNFQTVPMWVQVWGLPFDLIIKEAGRDIGQGIGRVIEVDCKAIASGEARFLRVRVDVPLNKPIRGGAPVLSPEGDKVWVAFKYERLSGLCFHCGLLGHEAKACETTKLEVWKESPYGEWLRATEDGPPQTGDSEVAQSHRDGNPSGHDIDGAETEPQNDMHGKSSSWSELEWLRQKLDCFDPKLLLSRGIRWLYHAFRLLLTNPTVKKLVVFLASDKAVRDVILRNTLVREFQWIPYAVNYVRPQISNEVPGWATRIWMRIWDGAKAKFEHIEKFLSQVKGLFKPPKSNNPTEGNKEQMEEKIRSSLPRSVVILLIEVVAQALPA